MSWNSDLVKNLSTQKKNRKKKTRSLKRQQGKKPLNLEIKQKRKIGRGNKHPVLFKGDIYQIFFRRDQLEAQKITNRSQVLLYTVRQGKPNLTKVGRENLLVCKLEVSRSVNGKILIGDDQFMLEVLLSNLGFTYYEKLYIESLWNYMTKKFQALRCMAYCICFQPYLASASSSAMWLTTTI